VVPSFECFSGPVACLCLLDLEPLAGPDMEPFLIYKRLDPDIPAAQVRKAHTRGCELQRSNCTISGG